VSFRLACEDAQQLGAVLSEAAPAAVSSAQTPPLRH
jgi:hypothetical protein